MKKQTKCKIASKSNVERMISKLIESFDFKKSFKLDKVQIKEWSCYYKPE